MNGKTMFIQSFFPHSFYHQKHGILEASPVSACMTGNQEGMFYLLKFS